MSIHKSLLVYEEAISNLLKVGPIKNYNTRVISWSINDKLNTQIFKWIKTSSTHNTEKNNHQKQATSFDYGIIMFGHTKLIIICYLVGQIMKVNSLKLMNTQKLK